MYELICQRPPFEAKSMDDLYKAVVRGKFSPIPDNYSTGLQRIISMLIKVSPVKRPTCTMLLVDAAVMKWNNKLFSSEGSAKAITTVDSARESMVPRSAAISDLLKTIKNCKNFKNLALKLPGSKYEKEISTINQNLRRETAEDVYGTETQKTLNSKSSDMNISIKRSKKQNQKGEVDYLEVEIKNQADDSVASISMNENNTKVKMKRKIVKNYSVKPSSNRDPEPVPPNELNDTIEAYKHNINHMSRNKSIETRTNNTVDKVAIKKSSKITIMMDKSRNGHNRYIYKKLPTIQNMVNLSHLDINTIMVGT